MHRHNRNNDYKNYFFLLPPTSTSTAQTDHYPLSNLRLNTQPTPYANETHMPTYTSPRSQQQSQPRTILPKPITIHNNRRLLKNQQSPVMAFPIIYRPPRVHPNSSTLNANRTSSVDDERLATATLMRERLLRHIQQNIHEIDLEISSMKRQPSVSPNAQSRLPVIPIVTSPPSPKKVPLPNDDNSLWPSKPKRAYQVVPRITEEVRRASQQFTPRLSEQVTPNIYVGQYHYAPEIEEVEIHDNDPENCELKLIAQELPQTNHHEIVSVNRFYQQSTDLAHNRALVLSPKSSQNQDFRVSKSIEEFHQQNPYESLAVKSMHELPSPSKSNIRNVSLITPTKHEPKISVSPHSPLDVHSSPTKVDLNLNNTILSKPVKHSRLIMNQETHATPLSQATKTPEQPNSIGMNSIVRDTHNENFSEIHIKSVHSEHLALPIRSKITVAENRNNGLNNASHTILSNLHPSQHQRQQQNTNENNNQRAKETEKKKLDPTTQGTLTPMSTSFSRKKILPISTYNEIETLSNGKRTNNNED